MSERLRIVTRRAPTPALLRPAIEARLADRPWPDGPEAAVADAVARAVRDAERSAGERRRR